MSDMSDLQGTSWMSKFMDPPEMLNPLAQEWKHTMSDILMDSDVFQEADLKRLKSDNNHANPAMLMEIRHQLVKDNSGFYKKFPTPKEYIMTEARKAIRMENQKLLKNEREARVVNKEIEQLRQAFDNQRLLKKLQYERQMKEVEKTPPAPPEKIFKKYNKVWKRLESYDACVEIDSWVQTQNHLGKKEKRERNIAVQMEVDESNKTTAERNLSNEIKKANHSLENRKVTKSGINGDVPVNGSLGNAEGDKSRSAQKCLLRKKIVTSKVRGEENENGGTILRPSKVSLKDSNESEKATDSNSGSTPKMVGSTSSSVLTEIHVASFNEASHANHWDPNQNAGKSAIMERFFQSTSDIERVKLMHRDGAFRNKKRKNCVVTQSCNGVCEMARDVNETQVPKKETNQSRRRPRDADMKILKIKKILNLWSMRYYWIRWREFVKEVRIQQYKLDRALKIEVFVKRLQERKVDAMSQPQEQIPPVRTRGKTEVKYRSKTAPVTLQEKFEKQRKYTNEKKLRLLLAEGTEVDSVLGEIEQEVKLSSKQAHATIDKTMKRLEPESQSRAKVIRKISASRDKVDKIEEQLRKSFPLPEVLQRMQKRDEERQKRWDAIRARKRKAEEERERLQKEKAEEERLREEEEKKRKFEEEKERRVQEKEAKEEKKRQRLRMKWQTELAHAHYSVTLVKTYGLDPLKCLLEYRRLQRRTAIEHCARRTVSNVLRGWRAVVLQETQSRVKKAERFYAVNLMKTVLTTWIDECNESIKRYQAAVDYAELSLASRYLKMWLCFVQDERLEFWAKEDQADRNYERKLPQVQRVEKEKEDRKRMWRQKVQEVLPDYRPLATDTLASMQQLTLNDERNFQ